MHALLIQVSLYILVGVISGFSSGILGIGGGLVVVPALAFIFHSIQLPEDLIMHMAAGTSMAVMLVTATASVRAHAKRGAQIWPIYQKLVIGVIIGTVCGAIFADFLPTKVLAILFALLVFVLAMRMIFVKPTEAVGGLPGPWIVQPVAWIVGFKSGLLGIGGGAITIPFLTRYNISMRDAVGVSVMCSLTIALIGTISLIATGSNQSDLPAYSWGYVYGPAVACVAIVSPIFATLGAKISHQIPVEILKRIFAGFLLVIAVKMLLVI